MERLHERGLIEGRGERKGRVYLLSAGLYKRLKMQAEYVRARGFEPLQMEQMVLNYVHKQGKITRSEVADLCRLSEDQAYRLIKRLRKKYPQIQAKGSGRGAIYLWESENMRDKP